MGFTVGAKRVVVLCGLAALLLTYAAFHDKFPHGDGVSVQGRKGLADSQLTPELGGDVVATEGVTVETIPEDSMPSEKNVDFTQENSEELHEAKAVREMEEIAPAAEPQVVIPEPEYSSPNPFLERIRQNNIEAAKKEDEIQACIAEDGCGTV